MLNDLKGVGPKTLKALNELNIFTLEDLIMYYPYRYNLYKPVKISEATEDNTVMINGYVENPVRVFFIKKNLNKLSFRLNTGEEIINVVIFNRAFIKPNLKPGSLISVLGKYSKKNNTLTASDIKLKPILKEEIEGVYHLNSNIKRSTFKGILNEALKRNIYVKSNIPDYLISKYNLLDKMDAIKEIHNPKGLKSIKNAKLTLVYEELFTYILKINYLKMYKTNENGSYVKNFDQSLIKEFIANLPFTLTQDQVNAIEEISLDFNSKRRMNRLLLGDVGSGKTIVAFISLYMNFLSGFQGILMAPTEILAEQHYRNFLDLFKDLSVKAELITSSLSLAARKELIKKIKNKEVDVLIGTHSVLNDEINFHNLGLVITDEQHRFGVNQRKVLENKGSLVDVLYMSATPIPRTLALTIYGDMDISQIKTKPSNRKEIETKVYKMSEIKNVLSVMLDEIKKNHQVYVVAPLIENEDGESEMNSVFSLADKINMAFNKKVPVAVLHGKLKSTEKDEIMKNFKDNNVKILISTTVIEVGIDVKNATIMAIFNAERFGLATLHQLRGRIGRSDLASKCLLISDYDTTRLKILEESNDGFYISEKDFELRGAGDLFGVKQSGDMIFKLADIKNDFKILLQCRDDSEEFLKANIDNLDRYPEQKNIIDSITFIN